MCKQCVRSLFKRVLGMSILDMGYRNGHGRRSKRQNLQWLRVHWAILLCKLHLTSFQLINNPSGSRACANTVFLRFFQASAWESRTYTVSETCRVKGPGKRPNVHSKLSIVVLLAKIQQFSICMMHQHAQVSRNSYTNCYNVNLKTQLTTPKQQHNNKT